MGDIWVGLTFMAGMNWITHFSPWEPFWIHTRRIPSPYLNQPCFFDLARINFCQLKTICKKKTQFASCSICDNFCSSESSILWDPKAIQNSSCTNVWWWQCSWSKEPTSLGICLNLSLLLSGPLCLSWVPPQSNPEIGSSVKRGFFWRWS